MTATVAWILSAVTTVLGIIEPFNKKMVGILIFNFAGNFLVAINYLIVGGEDAAVGTAICLVACVQVFINAYFAYKEKKIPTWLLITYLVVFLGVNILAYKAWFDLLALAAAVCYVFSISQQKPAVYRILYCANSALWILYDFMAGVYQNLATHIALTVFTLVSMYVYEGKEKKEEINPKQK